MAQLQINGYEKELIEQGMLIKATMQYALRTKLPISKAHNIILWYKKNLKSLTYTGEE